MPRRKITFHGKLVHVVCDRVDLKAEYDLKVEKQDVRDTKEHMIPVQTVSATVDYAKVLVVDDDRD